MNESEKYNILGIMTKISSTPSIIGSSILIFRFMHSDVLLKKNLSQRIIFYMSITDLLCSSFFFVGPWFFDEPILCSLEGFFIQLTVSGPLWNAALTTNILMRVVFGIGLKNADKLEVFYHIIAWGIPLLGAIIGIAKNAMVPVGNSF